MPELIVKLGDAVIQRFRFEDSPVTIGRARTNSIVVENLSVSRNHARIRLEDGAYVLTDLNSANGTFVNGVRVNKAQLNGGDVISIGKHRLAFSVGEAAATATTTASARPLAFDESLAAVLRVTEGRQAGEFFHLDRQEMAIGRACCNDIRLFDWNVGRSHAILTREQQKFYLRDLGSWRGSKVNGEPVLQAELNDGDELLLGDTRLELELGTPSVLYNEEEPEHATGPVPVYSRQGAAASPSSSPHAVEVISSDAPDGAAGAAQAADGPRERKPTPAAAIRRHHEPSPVPRPSPISPRPGGRIPTPDSASSGSLGPDEFEPFTEDELEELEREEASFDVTLNPDLVARAEWEQLEAERMLKEGAGWSANRPGVLIEDAGQLEEGERQLIPEPDHDALADQAGADLDHELEADDGREEEALFGAGASSPADDDAAPAPPPPIHQTSIEDDIDEMPVPEGIDPVQFRRWQRGLRNRSRVVRREAARKLKELTGIDYDWQSDPE